MQNLKHVSLYRKYRPQKFGEIAGQAAAVDMLVSALQNDKTGHAYIFSGPRGCGKTTAARLLAKSLNCMNRADKSFEPCEVCENCKAITQGESLDVVEIDGASNNSVDEARELKSQANLAPFNSRYKIYIIDEVHMLSIAAFNALLKIMEEPPDYVVFILATTEPHKVPVTIRSRCQHIPFHRINVKDIFAQLSKICDAEHENIKAEAEALWEIARQADGGMRDALSMLEQVINSAQGEIIIKSVEAALGAGSRPELEKWFAEFINQDADYYLDLKNILEACTSPERIFEELFAIGKNLWLASMRPDIIDALDVSEFENKFLRENFRAWRPEKLKLFLNAALRMMRQSRLDLNIDILAGMFALELDNIINPPQAPQANLSQQVIAQAAPQNFNNASASQAIAQAQNFNNNNVPASQAIAPANLNQQVIAPAKNLNNNNNNNEAAGFDWQPLDQELEQKIFSAAHDKNFILYCLLLDAEFLKFADKLLFRFENLYCYETARGDRYKFLAEAIIKSLWPDCRALYFNCNDLYFEYKFLDDNVPAKAISEIKPEPESSGADKAVKAEAINNRRTFADEIAYLMGGAVVMVKSDAAEAEAESEAEADDEESSEDLNLENENNDGDE
ncbi:MAG: DNA polymerase III subunit gamma/tau [Synergistaceae bacterium]|nr:DNA polymerase III subunit gamma/tau [Synergistaceae bacterium]